jgi:hypothetical protein
LLCALAANASASASLRARCGVRVSTQATRACVCVCVCVVAAVWWVLVAQGMVWWRGRVCRAGSAAAAHASLLWRRERPPCGLTHTQKHTHARTHTHTNKHARAASAHDRASYQQEDEPAAWRGVARRGTAARAHLSASLAATASGVRRPARNSSRARAPRTPCISVSASTCASFGAFLCSFVVAPWCVCAWWC